MTITITRLAELLAISGTSEESRFTMVTFVSRCHMLTVGTNSFVSVGPLDIKPFGNRESYKNLSALLFSLLQKNNHSIC